jgi:hypothetical protein
MSSASDTNFFLWLQLLIALLHSATIAVVPIKRARPLARENM